MFSSIKRAFSSTSLREAAERITWSYKALRIGYNDKTHQSVAATELMERQVDTTLEDLKEKGIDMVIARGPLHPPRPGDPPEAKVHVTTYGLAVKQIDGSEVEEPQWAFHLNEDGTIDEWRVPEHEKLRKRKVVEK